MKCNETVTNRVIWYIGYLDGFWYVFLYINLVRRKHQYSYIVLLNSTSNNYYYLNTVSQCLCHYPDVYSANPNPDNRDAPITANPADLVNFIVNPRPVSQYCVCMCVCKCVCVCVCKCVCKCVYVHVCL